MSNKETLFLAKVKATRGLVLAGEEIKVEGTLGGLSKSMGRTGNISPDALAAGIFLHPLNYFSNLNLLM